MSVAFERFEPGSYDLLEHVGQMHKLEGLQ